MHCRAAISQGIKTAGGFEGFGEKKEKRNRKKAKGRQKKVRKKKKV